MSMARTDRDVGLTGHAGRKRGQLTIFLGAADGVGKTYAMLESAGERLAEGVDVIVGWVEANALKEKESMLAGLQKVKPKKLMHWGEEHYEIDLDAILNLKPDLVLVDELAHTNTHGSRHTRRYQDVEELLAEGINVYTTLNVLNIESLNDVITRITGMSVRETVPDRIIDSAARIQLVDIAAEDLIQRLEDGKITFLGKVNGDLRKIYTPGIINALRELTLRYIARRLDKHVEKYMRSKNISGPWPVGDRIMVCVSSSPFSAQLIRRAWRMAGGLRTEWLAVNVETPQQLQAHEDAKDQLAKNMRLAEELGAETVTLIGNDVAEELVEFAKRRNISQIVVGKPLRPGLRGRMRKSVVDEIMRKNVDISVQVIPGKAQSNNEKLTSRVYRQFAILPYLWAMMLVVPVSVLTSTVRVYIGPLNSAMLFLLTVLFSAIKWGIGPGVVAAAAGVLTLDLFFIVPFYRVTFTNLKYLLKFSLMDLGYLLSFFIFVLVAIIAGRLSQNLKHQVASARQREARTAALYELSRNIVGVDELGSVLSRVARKVAEIVEGQVVILMPDDKGELQQEAGSETSENSFFNDNEYDVAVWSFQHGKQAGGGTGTFDNAAGTYFPLYLGENCRGVLGVRPSLKEYLLKPEHRRLLEAFADLTAAAVTRVQLADQARETRLLSESERLRTALFNSLSHDLRTPLASVIGAVTGLLDGEELYSADDRHALLVTIMQGASRMDRFISNLLDMARMESDMLRLNKVWCDLQDIIGVAVSQLGEPLNSRPLKIDIAPDLPMVQADYGLIEQVMINLLDNTLKYSNIGTEISVRAFSKDKYLQVEVVDRGPEISKKDLERIFDRFYRLYSPRLVHGTGLGLAICKAIIEAHGGRIWAEQNPAGGMVIKFVLPLSNDNSEQV